MKTAEQTLDDTFWFEPCMAKEKMVEAIKAYGEQVIDNHIERLNKILSNSQYAESPRLKEGLMMAIINANKVKDELK